MRALFLAAVLLTAWSSSEAADLNWHWIWITPAPDPTKGWTTFQGEAPVHFDGTNLDATVSGSGEWEPELHIQGRVTGRFAHAVVTQLGTDASPRQYSGTYWKFRSKLLDASRGWGSDRIVLHDGPNYLGLYRETPPVP